MLFARTEGIIPAPETSHAIAVRDPRGRARPRRKGKEKVILFNLSGHGLMDLGSYEKYLAGGLTDIEYPAHEIDEAVRLLAKYPKPQALKSR